MASSGDVLLLGPGTFRGPGNRDLDPGSLGKADLTITGRQGPQATIMDLEGSGRLFYFSALAGNAVVANLTLVNGNCANYPDNFRRGGGFALVQANVTLSDLILQKMNCISDTVVFGGDFSGGAVFLSGAGSLLQRLVFQDCTANHGAAIACWGTEQSTVEDSTFERNYGRFWGGTVLTEENSQTIFRRCYMSYGSSPYGGHVDDSGTAAASFTDCTFEYGSAQEGGGYLSYGATHLVFTNCSFSHNVADSSGGAVSLSEQSHPTFVGVNFTNNSAFSGGAVVSTYLGGTGPVLFKKVRFTQNVGRSKCALQLMNWATFEDAVFEENSNQCLCMNSLPGHGLVIRNSRFVGNVARDSGGAIAATLECGGATAVPLELSEVTFDSNVAAGVAVQSGGGAIAVTGLHALTVVNCTFVNNSAAGLGGAISYIPGGSLQILPVVINDTLFARNSGNASGGSLYIGGSNQQGLSLNMARSIVESSSSFGNGGGALLDTATLVIQNSNFVNNVAIEGNGGGLVVGPTPTCGAGGLLRNVGFSGNRALVGGGALFFLLAEAVIPPCAVPTLPGQAAVWNPQTPSAWAWTSFGNSVSNNIAGFGPLQATSPVQLQVSCAGADAFAGLGTCLASGGIVAIFGFLGMPLGLSVQVHDMLGQVGVDDALLVEAVLVTPSVNGTTFFLNGPSRFRFDNGTAILKDTSLAASAFPGTSVQLVLAIQLPFAMRLSLVPRVQVTITLDTALGSCPAGHVPGAASTAVRCTPCPSGSFASAGDATCTGCPTGRFASSPGSTSCASCPVGSGCPAGTSMPAPCSAGTAQSQAGQERCEPCGQGFYAPSTGQAQCLPCPSGTSTKLEGTDQLAGCVCQQGSFMTANTSTCQACTEGMACPTGSTSPGQAADFFVQVGSAGAEAFRCAPSHCVAGSPGTCASGRVGFVCARCQQGFYPLSGGACVPCQNSDVLPFVVTIAGALLCLGFLTFLARTDVSRQSLLVLTGLSVAGQALVAVQMLTMINKISVRWPGSVKGLLDIVAVLRFDFGPLRYQCVVGFDQPLIAFILELLAFPAAVAGLLFISFVLWLCRRPVPRDDLYNNIGLLVTLCFLPATVMAVTPFDCVANPNGSSSIKKLPAILCGTPLHSSVVAAGTIAVMCYSVTVLCGTGLVTFYYPRIIAGGGGPRLLRRFRFLFYRFKPNRYYYGFVFLVRSTLITLVPLISRAGTEVLGFAFVVAAFSLLQCTLQPWRTSVSNLCDAVFSLLLLMLLVAVAVLQEKGTSSATAAATFVLVVLLLVVLSPVVVLAAIGLKLLHSRGRGKRCHLFISHHKTDASSLARYLKHTAKTRAHAQAFLDSDQLQDLDTLLDAVRRRTQNLVILLTKETLRRPWCSGEIVMAHKCGVPIVVVACGEVDLLTDEELNSFDESWTPEQLHQLQVMGLSIDDIRAAYRHLRTLEVLQMPTTFQSRAELDALHGALRRVLEACSLSSWTPAVYQSYGGCHSIIIANSSDLDAVSGALLLQEMVQAEAQIDISLCLTGEEAEMACDAAAVLIFLTPGCLESQDFMAAACAAVASVPNVICVQGHPSFRHPESSSLPALARRMAQSLGQEYEESLQETYGRFVSLIAVPFSTGLNKQVVSAQVELLCDRLRKVEKLPFQASWTPSHSLRPTVTAATRAAHDRDVQTEEIVHEGPGALPVRPSSRKASRSAPS